MRVAPRLVPRTEFALWRWGLLWVWLTGSAFGAVPTLIESGGTDTVGLAKVTMTLTPADLGAAALLPGADPTEGTEPDKGLDALVWVRGPVGARPLPSLDWRWADQHMVITATWPGPVAAEGPELWVLRGTIGNQSVDIAARVDPALEVIGPVDRGTTLWSLVNRWPLGDDEGQTPVEARLVRWVEANPHAFVDADPATLRQGALLVVPNQAFQNRRPPKVMPLIKAAAPANGAPDRASPPLGVEAWLDPWWVAEAPPAWVQQRGGEGVALTRAAAEDPGLGLGVVPSDERLPLGTIARWGGSVLLVLVALMVLQGLAHRVFGRPKGPARAVSPTAAVGPGAPTLMWALAEWSAQHGDRAQAFHWLNELRADASPKLTRQAQRLKRQLQAEAAADRLALSDARRGRT